MQPIEQFAVDKLAELRREAKRVGMTQEALAVAGGVSSSTLRRWKARKPAFVAAVGRMEAAIEAKRQSIPA